jgi:hypothetical protein
MSLTAPCNLTNTGRPAFPWRGVFCVRDHVLVILLGGLVALPLVAGCSLSPVSPAESLGDGIPPTLTAQPGRALNLFSTISYQPCVTITISSLGRAAGIERIDLSVLASDQSVVASTTANYSPFMLRQNLKCEGPSVSTAPSARAGTTYRVTATYRFIDGTGGELAGTSTFQ